MADMGTLLIIGVIAFYISGSLTTLATDTILTTRRSYTATFGSLAGLMSYSYLKGFTLVLDFIDVCIQGGLGMGGYFFVLGLVSMLAVWMFNLYSVRRLIV